MKIAIASGKGGTGKTTLATALAQALPVPVQLLDCDVEEPNAHIFLNPQLSERDEVTVTVPALDGERCSHCGRCGEICRFNAIVCLSDQTMIFPQMCHSCGGCLLVCTEHALHEHEKVVGHIDSGCSGTIAFTAGTLAIGEAMSPPVIRAVKQRITADTVNIIDCPPGTSCPMITAVDGCDFAVLVTEPTPFGLHDLKLAVATLRQLSLPFGVVVNRAGSGDERVENYCRGEKVPLLLQIADSREVAVAYSRGEGILTALPQLKEQLRSMVDEIKQLLNGDTQ